MQLNFKKSKLYIGITLVVQSITFLALFIMLYSKKRSFASAFLALAGIGGTFGGYLLYLAGKEEEEESKEYSDYLERVFHEDYPEDDDETEASERIEIEPDETVDESEFT